MRRMKPSEKKLRDKRNPLIGKLLDLKYRINDVYRSGVDLKSGSSKDDKAWVMGQISALREGARLDRHQMNYANGLWRKYDIRTTS